MDENRENLTCLRVADFRESGRTLPSELLSHASLCTDCVTVDEVNGWLREYEFPDVPFSPRRLWEKIPEKKPGLGLIFKKIRLQITPSFRYAMAALLLSFIGILFILNHSKGRIGQVAVRILPKTRPIASLPTLTVTRVHGSVFVQAGSEWKPLQLQAALPPLSTVRVMDGGKLRLTFPGDTEVVFVSKTETTIKSIASSSHPFNSIYLAYGKAFIHHRGNGFQMNTPQASIDAIGTDFSVRYQNDTTHVRVFSGQVRLRSGKESALIGREEELRFVPRGKARVRRFHLRESDDWERGEIPVVYFKQGKMVVKPLRPVVMPHIPLRHVPDVHYYDEHLKRREIKNEEQIQIYDEKVTKKEDELLKEQEKHDQKINP